MIILLLSQDLKDLLPPERNEKNIIILQMRANPERLKTKILNIPGLDLVLKIRCS